MVDKERGSEKAVKTSYELELEENLVAANTLNEWLNDQLEHVHETLGKRNDEIEEYIQTIDFLDEKIELLEDKVRYGYE